MPYELDKEKYLKILKTEGLPAAITALHEEMDRMEIESFEGPQGYQPEYWESIKKFREFSCELWTLTPVPTTQPNPN